MGTSELLINLYGKIVFIAFSCTDGRYCDWETLALFINKGRIFNWGSNSLLIIMFLKQLALHIVRKSEGVDSDQPSKIDI